METIEIIYNCAALLSGLYVFKSKVTSPNPSVQFIGGLIFSLLGLFLMLYSGIRIFKTFGLI